MQGDVIIKNLVIRTLLLDVLAGNVYAGGEIITSGLIEGSAYAQEVALQLKLVVI